MIIHVSKREEIPWDYEGAVGFHNGDTERVIRRRERHGHCIYASTQRWYRFGKLHRDGSPAVIHKDGTEEWRQNHQWHREDGPSIIHPDGRKMWHFKGEYIDADGIAFCFQEALI